MPEDLLKKAREYAQKHGTTLNQMIRDLWKEQVEEDRVKMVEEMRSHYGKIQVDTTKLNDNRDELHER